MAHKSQQQKCAGCLQVKIELQATHVKVFLQMVIDPTHYYECYVAGTSEALLAVDLTKIFQESPKQGANRAGKNGDSVDPNISRATAGPSHARCLQIDM